MVQGRLPPPLLFHPRIHPELEAVTRRAVSLIPSYRYEDAGALTSAIRWALRMERRRSTEKVGDLRLEIASETHIGLLKQRYCAENQDSHFHSWDPTTHRGIFSFGRRKRLGVRFRRSASQVVSDAAEAL